jgi:RES domain-containing protein
VIFTALGPITAYRMHSPRWASAPTSGAGAAAHGGRVNRPGTAALYLALEAQTALQEYQQLSPLMPPGTLVSYTAQLARVLDFSAGFDAARWPALWEEFYADWRELWFNQRVEPPSWVLGDEAMAAGAAGLLFASALVPGGRNLVVFNDCLTAADTLRVYDPAGELPKNQDSWR